MRLQLPFRCSCGAAFPNGLDFVRHRASRPGHYRVEVAIPPWAPIFVLDKSRTNW